MFSDEEPLLSFGGKIGMRGKTDLGNILASGFGEYYSRVAYNGGLVIFFVIVRNIVLFMDRKAWLGASRLKDI